MQSFWAQKGFVPTVNGPVLQPAMIKPHVDLAIRKMVDLKVPKDT